jgi:putative membrane protein
MWKFLIRLLINGIAIWLASLLIDGIDFEGSAWQILMVILVFGLVNAILKPLFKLIALPLVIWSLGLFTLVINALLLLLVSWLTSALSVDGFWPALLGSIIIRLVSWLLSLFLGDD